MGSEIKKHRTKTIMISKILIFVLSFIIVDICYAFERIVVLYAAASPVLEELGAADKIVGITRTDRTFNNVTSVGSHLRPNIELLKALRPDLIIAGSKKAFPDRLSRSLKSEVFYFDPRNLNEILFKIKKLGEMLNREKEASYLIRRLKERLSELKPLKIKPTVIYEISARPLKVAGKYSIITSIIEHAGGVNLITVHKKHVLISPEKVIKLAPDVYIYQTGPMNKNPEPPKNRNFFRSLKSRVIKVNEYEFARPGLNAFDATVKLNRIFQEIQR
jgi:iron complex transport system substrate-binding protein